MTLPVELKLGDQGQICIDVTKSNMGVLFDIFRRALRPYLHPSSAASPLKQLRQIPSLAIWVGVGVGVVFPAPGLWPQGPA